MRPRTAAALERFPWSSHGGSLRRLWLLGRVLDDARDFRCTRDEDEVTGLELRDFGPHPFRHEPLELRVDGLILGPDDVPRRNRFPRRWRGQRLTQRAAGDRLLLGGERRRLLER